MTLQQLRYLIAAADARSVAAASRNLFVSQSSISVAIQELEREMHVKIFTRTSRGMTLTTEGLELLGYARQVVHQADLMVSRYAEGTVNEHKVFSVSAQHYSFCASTLLDIIADENPVRYTFTLHEASTIDVIEDVRTLRSELGIIYFDEHNYHAISKTLREARLEFVLLFTSRIYACFGAEHPLASAESVQIEELAEFPRVSFGQERNNASFYSEEPLDFVPSERNIILSDRDSMLHFLRYHDAYTISSGILHDNAQQDIVAVPVACDDVMRIGYIRHTNWRLSDIAQDFVSRLAALSEEEPTYA